MTLSFTRVVNAHKGKSAGRYIGRESRGMHFGNPFAIGGSTLTSLSFEAREEALHAFWSWITGEAHVEVEPRRRNWIIANLESLRGQTLVCFCKPHPCHGDLYRVLLGEIPLEEALPELQPGMPGQETQLDLFG